MSHDGRLDLDDLGSVIEGASTIDDTRDVVGDDAGATWGERLGAAGITPWLRRRRIPVVLAAAVVATAAVAGTAWSRSQPPSWHEATIAVVAASADINGPGLASPEDGLLMAAYLLTSDDPRTSLTLDGIDGPGIRASTVGPPHPDGNQSASVVRAVIGCDGVVLGDHASQYRLHVTETDEWGRSRPALVDVPAADFGWSDAVRQSCWQKATAGHVRIGDIRARVEQGAASVALQVDVVSSMGVDAMILFPGTDEVQTRTRGDSSGVGVGLVAGGTKAVDLRIEVTDCSAGGPPVPTVTVPLDPSVPNAYHQVDGVAVWAQTADGRAGAEVGLPFTSAQSQIVRRALAPVCAGTPTVRLTDLTVVRSTPDESQGAVTLTLAVTTAVPRDRQMQVVIPPDWAIGGADTGDLPWLVVPRGGGRAEASWTFSCGTTPTPPSLAVRFVDSTSPTPVKLPLSQSTIAPWVSEACPSLTESNLVENGWSLP